MSNNFEAEDYVDVERLVQKGLGYRDVDPEMIRGLTVARVAFQEKLLELGTAYTLGRLAPADYIIQYDNECKKMQTIGRHLMGKDDWNKCFGEMRVHHLMDLKTFYDEAKKQA